MDLRRARTMRRTALSAVFVFCQVAFAVLLIALSGVLLLRTGGPVGPTTLPNRIMLFFLMALVVASVLRYLLLALMHHTSADPVALLAALAAGIITSIWPGYGVKALLAAPACLGLGFLLRVIKGGGRGGWGAE
jgi:hypothetical protein